jgi:hypothetical protein
MVAVDSIPTVTSPAKFRNDRPLQELAPRAAVVGFLVNPNSPNLASELKEAHSAIAASGHKLVVVEASTESEFDSLIRRQ